MHRSPELIQIITMFASIVRVFLLFIACVAIVHAYPPSMSRTKWIPSRVGRPFAVRNGENYEYQNIANENENENDLNDSNGFATWLFRSRKFCCAPPL